VTILGICLDLRQPYIINEFVQAESLKDLLKREEDTLEFNQKLKMVLYKTKKNISACAVTRHTGIQINTPRSQINGFECRQSKHVMGWHSYTQRGFLFCTET